MDSPNRHIVPPSATGQRLDQFLAGLLEARGLSRERVKRLILAGQILVDGQTAQPKLRLAGGEVLDIRMETEGLGEHIIPEPGGIRILFQDEHLLVLNKPAGLTVHPAPSQPQGTLVHRLLHHFPQLGTMEGQRPGIVHRIDKDTSGLLVVALDEGVRLALSRAFAERQVDKRYLAVVHGSPNFEPKGEVTITLPLGRHPTSKTRMAVLAKGGRPAKTVCRPLWSSPDRKITLVEAEIHTGRTHQIRVHLSHQGHPLLGDALYGGTAHALPGKPLLPGLARRQMLHAWKLGLNHPATGKPLSFTCPPPKDILRPLMYMGRGLQRVAVTGLPGSGKSSLVRFLAELGAPVFSADAAVAELYTPGGDGYALIERRFGQRFVPESGGPLAPIDKKALFAAMREDEALRREIMTLIHPLVRHRLANFYAAHAGCRLAVAEIPLLFESGWRAESCDLAVAVHSRDEDRLARLLARGLSPEEAAALDSWQWPGPDKFNAADLVVENLGTLEDLKTRALRLWRTLQYQRRNQARELWAHLHAVSGSPPPSFGV